MNPDERGRARQGMAALVDAKRRRAYDAELWRQSAEQVSQSLLRHVDPQHAVENDPRHVGQG